MFYTHIQTVNRFLQILYDDDEISDFMSEFTPRQELFQKKKNLFL